MLHINLSYVCSFWILNRQWPPGAGYTGWKSLLGGHWGTGAAGKSAWTFFMQWRQERLRWAAEAFWNVTLHNLCIVCSSRLGLTWLSCDFRAVAGTRDGTSQRESSVHRCLLWVILHFCCVKRGTRLWIWPRQLSPAGLVQNISVESCHYVNWSHEPWPPSWRCWYQLLVSYRSVANVQLKSNFELFFLCPYTFFFLQLFRH